MTAFRAREAREHGKHNPGSARLCAPRVCFFKTELEKLHWWRVVRGELLQFWTATMLLASWFESGREQQLRREWLKRLKA